MNKLNNFLEQCEESYYKGEPIIPDEVYDRLKTQYDSVGYRLSSKTEKIPHIVLKNYLICSFSYMFYV